MMEAARGASTEQQNTCQTFAGGYVVLPGSFTSHDLIQYSICEQEHGRARCHKSKAVKSYCTDCSLPERAAGRRGPTLQPVGSGLKGQLSCCKLHSAQPLLMA